MSSSQVSPAPGNVSSESRVDAIVLGAGFAGICALYQLRALGLSARAIEAAPDVGGTWYWNRYPGARTDSEAWAYCYSFSEELTQDWNWSDRLPSQEQVQSYLAHVVDRFDLRKAISFNTRIAAAVYDENDNLWTLTSEDGQTFKCTYFIAATGPLSAPYIPDIAGLDSFRGECYMAAKWPAEDVDLAGKRVALIGSGSTGIQLLPMIAMEAEHVSLLQRTPNYVLPSRNHPIEKAHMKALKADHVALREQVQNHTFAFPLVSPNRNYDDVSDESERRKILEAGWEAGGFRFVFQTFDDIFTDKRTNEVVAEFIRDKIRSIVRDPQTAEALCPHYVFGAKRPPTGTGYYEAFNRENVSLVDVSHSPIERITENGIRIAGEEHPFDVIILATGFEAATGAMGRMSVVGRDGCVLKDKWSGGPTTNLGIMVENFPNMFMILGPQSPFANAPPVIENVVNWIVGAIGEAQRRGFSRMEPTADGMSKWGSHVQNLFEQTLFYAGIETRAWFLGANIPGHEPAVLFHFGGAAKYFSDLDETVSDKYSGFKIY